MLKQSRFNIVDREHVPALVYNSYTGALAALNRDYLCVLEHGHDESSPEIEAELYEGGFLVDDDVDELDHVRSVSSICRNQSDALSFTIAPTLNCNFRCPYCYEEGKRYGMMGDDCVAAVVSHIEECIRRSQAKSIQIAWYGGEPLLALEAIERITEAIRPKVSDYVASMVSNGYYLSRQVAVKLGALGVRHVQVTVDGPPEIHNVRRRLPSGGDTFDRIVRNIEEASTYLEIVVRVNIDPTNGEQIDKLIESLDERGLRDKVKVYLAAVDDINGSCADTECYSGKEFAQIEAEYLSKYKLSGYTTPYLPGFNPSICGAVNRYSEVIGPDGLLYKCWNEIGDPNRSYGSVFDSEPSWTAGQWSTYDFSTDDRCVACELLPMCMGGCPFMRLYQGRTSCISAKYNCINVMRAAYELAVGR